MKLEIIKETKHGEKDWYMLYIDNSYFQGSYKLETLTTLYDDIKKTNGECLKSQREVLCSEIIDVSSQK